MAVLNCRRGEYQYQREMGAREDVLYYLQSVGAARGEYVQPNLEKCKYNPNSQIVKRSFPVITIM